MELIFEWDRNKAKSNLKDHKVTFEEGKTVFQDDLLITFFDSAHSDQEDRFISIGTSSNSRVLLVVHTENSKLPNSVIIRIISCRKASAAEKRIYESGEA